MDSLEGPVHRIEFAACRSRKFIRQPGFDPTQTLLLRSVLQRLPCLPLLDPQQVFQGGTGFDDIAGRAADPVGEDARSKMDLDLVDGLVIPDQQRLRAWPQHFGPETLRAPGQK